MSLRTSPGDMLVVPINASYSLWLSVASAPIVLSKHVGHPQLSIFIDPAGSNKIDSDEIFDLPVNDTFFNDFV